MGRLWSSFVVGSTALLCTGVIFGSRIFPSEAAAVQIVGGLVLGVLASIVLYAVMETMARQVSVHVVHIADWPKLCSAIFVVGMYTGAALVTAGFQTYVRSNQCSGSRPCAVSFAKGAVWSAIWPVYWPVYVTGVKHTASR
jgi:hypothetical protein